MDKRFSPLLQRVQESAAAGLPAYFEGEQAISWAEVQARATELRKRLGFADEQVDGWRIALAVRDPLNFLIALLAFLEPAVELLPLHPRWTTNERAAFLTRFPAHGVLDDSSGEIDWISGGATELVQDPAALLIPTSGSTGLPKAVLLDAAAIEASASASQAALGLSASDRWQAALPLAHMGGISPLFRMAWVGGALLPNPRVEQGAALALDPRVTAVSVVPLLLRRWLDAGVTPPDGLRLVLCGGASTPHHWLAEALAKGWPILTTYGMTETASQVTCVSPEQPKDSLRGSGSPLPGVELRFRDTSGELSSEGSLELRSQTLFRAYRGDAAETARRLVDGWLNTGDIAKFDGGQLVVLGRADELVIRGGENVYPAEVEQSLRQQGIATDACVIGVESDRWGMSLVAVLYQPAEGARDAVVKGDEAELILRRASPSVEAELIAKARESLAVYKVPERWYFVSSWPETASGKVNKALFARALRELG